MSTELDELKQACAAEEHPLPSDASRDSAIANAMQAFAQETSSNTQGSHDPDRLTPTRTSVFKNLFGRRPMNLNLPNLKPMMIGGASLAVLSLAILNTQYVRQERPESSDSGGRDMGVAVPMQHKDTHLAELDNANTLG